MYNICCVQSDYCKTVVTISVDFLKFYGSVFVLFFRSQTPCTIRQLLYVNKKFMVIVAV